MKKLSPGILVVILCGFAPTADLSAHHGAAQFDQTKEMTISGFVTKLDWRDPHVYVYLNVKDDSGKVANWTVESGSTTDLDLAGWTREKLAIGTGLTVKGSPPRGFGLTRVIRSQDFSPTPTAVLVAPLLTAK